MLEALKVDIPILNFLDASEIITAEQVVNNQLWLVILLKPASQPYLGALDPDTARLSIRKFSEEVSMARRQMNGVEWRIRRALGEGCSPIDGTVTTPHQSSTASIRQRVRSNVKGGKIWIPADQYGMEIEIGSVPDHLIRGAEICITARVVSLERRSATLEQVSIKNDFRARVKDIPLIKTCDKLQRVLGPHHHEWGTLLQLAMDHQTVLQLPIVVTLDWVTGSAIKFQLSGPPR